MVEEYVSRVLRVDLDRETISIQNLDEGTVRKYIGGIGFAANILWEETTADTEPLSPDNPLIFMIGPLSGLVPCSSRYIIAAISPQTYIWGESHAGGTWGYELKHAGFDGAIIKGRAKKPVYLWINDGKAEIVNADQVWGKDTYEVCDLLRDETDKKASVAAIGPAGEKLVKIAGVITDGRDGRAAARCGLGAVMGSKKLKAVVVRGSLKPKIANEERLNESTNKMIQKIFKEKRKYAPGTVVGYFMDIADVPIKNWLRGGEQGFEGFLDKWSTYLKEISPKNKPCKTCPVGCGESFMVEGVRHTVYEALAPLGSMCLIDDMESIDRAYQICNRYGLDAISAGDVIAFAMECYEKGLITKDDTDGMELKFGNAEAMVEMVKKIGEKEGFGKILGEGVKKTAEKIGGVASEYAVHVKGLEFPAHDPRSFNSLALAYATANRGACHVESFSYQMEGSDFGRWAPSPDLGYPKQLYRLGAEGKAELVVKMQNFMTMISSLVCCNFSFTIHNIQPPDFLEWLNCVTGWNMDLTEFMKIGERIFNLKRMFNVRRGISRKDDILPQRILTHKRREAGLKEGLPHLGEMLSEYYIIRGWSEEGIPTKDKLFELNLKECLNYFR